ncbi:MAG: hypothetical protein IPP18_17080 [Rhodocyclaceae bacterium]|nr:hypothetical protein [Rhodocyclaceae bacterium]
MDYSYEVFVDHADLGHAFIKFTDVNGNSETWGYYSRDRVPQGIGELRPDSTHPYDWSSGPVEITQEQYQQMHDYAQWVYNHSGDYGLFGNNCVEFVEDMLRKTNQLPYWTDVTAPDRLPAEPARVKVVVASVMQPTVEYRDQPNASL